jgi:hypothetical protein
MKRKGMIYFSLTHKETDLYIGVNKENYSPELPQEVYKWVVEIREELDLYIQKNKSFLTSLEPLNVDVTAPDIVKKMINAANSAGVGPMAAVAGAFSQEIGGRLKLEKGVKEVIVENGGDLYLDVINEITIGIYAGTSPLSNRIGFKISPEKMPRGVCTSAGTVGHSLSFGKADAVVVISPSTFHADTYATAIGNKIKSPEDLTSVIEWVQELPEVTGIIIVVGEKLGIWGEIELIPL